jgi:phosphatidylglycerol:prolipoprotein diacylglycerol transferase
MTMIPYELHKVFLEKSFDLGFTQVHWVFPFYTLMMFLGIASGAYLIDKKNRKEKNNRVIHLKVFIIVALFAMVGGRLFHNIFYKVPDPWYLMFIEMFKIWDVGMVSVGGFIFGAAALILTARHYGLNALRMLDNASPSIALGLFFARIGCFLAGCCYGIVTSLPWGIMRGAKIVHPTQIYSSFYNLTIFVILYLFATRKHKPGEVFGLWLILYGTCRFAIEFIRINPPIILGLSNQQVFSLLMVVGGLFLFRDRFKKKLP